MKVSNTYVIFDSIIARSMFPDFGITATIGGDLDFPTRLSHLNPMPDMEVSYHSNSSGLLTTASLDRDRGPRMAKAYLPVQTRVFYHSLLSFTHLGNNLILVYQGAFPGTCFSNDGISCSSRDG